MSLDENYEFSHLKRANLSPLKKSERIGEIKNKKGDQCSYLCCISVHEYVTSLQGIVSDSEEHVDIFLERNWWNMWWWYDCIIVSPSHIKHNQISSEL